MDVIITNYAVKDIRFPTSQYLDGSDAMNPDPDYSATYLILYTNKAGLEGHGLTFTIGRGNEICVAAVEVLMSRILGHSLSGFTNDMGACWHYITSDSQLRWLGPDKGVIHLATAAVLNAIWDLWAKVERKPLWRLLTDMTPKELVQCATFKYISDVITPAEAILLLEKNSAEKEKRMELMQRQGYPGYTTSVGWIGYSDDKLRSLSRRALGEQWNHFKIKVGLDLQDDIRRLSIIREEIGPDRLLMVDANQKWEISEAIEWMKQLAHFNITWIEEPTSPDDILGHATIRQALKPLGIGVATGEHCHNQVMFKQLFQAKAIDYCQIDTCRLASVNEILSVLFMAAKFKIPVCPHAGGVGLCEYAQHISIVDYLCISGSLENRVLEYVDHLHEHFLDPVVIKNAHYQLPVKPGYSIAMKPSTLAQYAFPSGIVWEKAQYANL